MCNSADTKKRTHVTGVTTSRNQEASAKHRCVAFSGWCELLGESGNRKGGFTHSMPRPCRSPAMPCRYGFIMCLSHLIYTVRPRLIHTCHAAPMPCSDHAVHLKATAHRGRRETACGRPACYQLLPVTTRSSKRAVISSIPISDAGGRSETK
jgi:hypothetical protein